MSTVESDLHINDEHDTDNAVAAFVRRAPRISQADVFRAADELLLEGHRPTIDRVRMRLGRGSPNTINDHLDAWWAKLGSRLRDVPGHEFPQLPERVAQALQHLWNEALAGAHEVLQSTLLDREQSLLQRETALQQAAVQLAEREQTASARAIALEESLTLAREQLVAANHRAEALEGSVQERDRECARLRERIETLEARSTEVRLKFDAATIAHQAERSRLQERHAAAESHWLREVDRARQHAKDAAKEHQNQVKELRNRVEVLQEERDELAQNLIEARTDLKTAAAVREQLEARLRAPPQAAMSPKQDPTRKATPQSQRRRRTRGGSNTGNSK